LHDCIKYLGIKYSIPTDYLYEDENKHTVGKSNSIHNLNNTITLQYIQNIDLNDESKIKFVRKSS
jgi:hypothetical protein